jgi:hypothetical protein
LKRSDNAQAEMAWAEQRLFEENLLHCDPPKRDLRAWTEHVIADNPDLVDSLPYLAERDCRPERAQTFENLVLSMIPSEGCRW